MLKTKNQETRQMMFSYFDGDAAIVVKRHPTVAVIHEGNHGDIVPLFGPRIGIGRRQQLFAYLNNTSINNALSINVLLITESR